ncbi:MAG TPA: transglycosylase domain-containing protein, partial [Acidimicrobiales bacterium]|nr:transglycosylase domain-containing protein [Acidimicrobiales bacterium]
EKRRPIVKIDQFPEHVRQAVLAAEDKDFYSHGGVDPSGVLRALFRTARGETQGGSTITQQLAKNNYTAGERTFLRKFREVLYATKLEQKYTKDELLERYLNQIYLGEGAYGMPAAAETFFGVPADKLTPSQAALLAAKIRSPEGLDPRKDLKRVTGRRDEVLNAMRRLDSLDDAQHKAALAEPVQLVPPAPVGAGRTPHFNEFVKREGKTLDALGGTPEARQSQLFNGGYVIETTLDPKVYDATVSAVQKRLGEPGDPFTATATVVPGDGAIRSLFGGLDFAKTQFDMSSLGRRQPGSSYKPFVYLAALREKIDPRSQFDGTSGRVIPCYGDKPVNNYAGEDAGGLITVDDAMVKSVNVVFVDLGCQAGVKNVLEAATDDGISEEATKAQGAIFLGGLDKGVNALEMASAFGTFTARGKYAEPYAIARIKNRDGGVIYERKPKTSEVFAAEEVGVLNNPLQRVVSEGTGKAAAIGRPVIAKTGTSQDNNNAWLVGATPQLATGVWVGYEPMKPMTNVHGRAVTGGSFPAAIFSDLMRAAHRGVPVQPIFTASPDSLGLRMIGPTSTTSSTSSTSSTTSTTAVTPPPTEVGPAPTVPPRQPPGRQTTTTARPTTTTSRPATTTTIRDQGQPRPASATTTTQPG